MRTLFTLPPESERLAPIFEGPYTSVSTRTALVLKESVKTGSWRDALTVVLPDDGLRRFHEAVREDNRRPGA
ncbi:hypothetical protein [Oceanibaculum nanhaiense]|uniref:hypothetical protein n=1 Tax=Oceanibaculum nanhaiense TaxID=1909734 RepID=UPI003D2779F0